MDETSRALDYQNFNRPMPLTILQSAQLAVTLGLVFFAGIQTFFTPKDPGTNMAN